MVTVTGGYINALLDTTSKDELNVYSKKKKNWTMN